MYEMNYYCCMYVLLIINQEYLFLVLSVWISMDFSNSYIHVHEYVYLSLSDDCEMSAYSRVHIYLQDIMEFSISFFPSFLLSRQICH